jgi:23S rRNA (uracil1939-C5)-methyltransferase
MAEVQLNIESIATGGDGVARRDGLVVFVPRTAPGDVVRVAMGNSNKARFSRAKLVQVIEPSSTRVDAPCEHYKVDNCGGCQLQHMNYNAQLEAKASIIENTIERIAKRRVEVPPVEPSVEEWRYRRKLTMALRRRGERWIAGLHPYDAPGNVFELDDCPITAREVLDIWSELMQASRWLPHEASLRGAVSINDKEITFVLEGGREWANSAKLFDAAPSLTELWWTPLNGRRELLHSRPRSESAREDSPEGGTALGASFMQVNARVADEIREYVLGVLNGHAPRTLIDAYAGRGDLAIAASHSGIVTVAIELDRNAVAAGRSRLLPPSRMVAGLVEDRLESALPADVVVLNPPRSGLNEQVPKQLDAAARNAHSPRALIYVSCDPATLARDIARLTAYRVASVRAFDMFPQTAHVETVCELVREAA